MGAEALQNFGGYFGAAGFEDGVERFKPFLNFYVVDAVRAAWGPSLASSGCAKVSLGCVKISLSITGMVLLLKNRKREVRALKTYTCDKENRIHPPGKFMLAAQRWSKKKTGLESATAVEHQNFAGDEW